MPSHPVASMPAASSIVSACSARRGVGQVAADASVMHRPWRASTPVVSASKPRRSVAATVSRTVSEPSICRATARTSPRASFGWQSARSPARTEGGALISQSGDALAEEAARPRGRDVGGLERLGYLRGSDSSPCAPDAA